MDIKKASIYFRSVIDDDEMNHDYNMIPCNEDLAICTEYILHNNSDNPTIKGTQEITITFLEDENA